MSDENWDPTRQGDLSDAPGQARPPVPVHPPTPARPPVPPRAPDRNPPPRNPPIKDRLSGESRPPAPAHQPPPRNRPVPEPPVPTNANAPTEIIDEVPAEATGKTEIIDEISDDGLSAEPTQALEPARPAAEPRAGAAAPRRGHGRRIGALAGYTVLGLVSLLVLGITGYAWGQYTTLDDGIHKSNALASPTEKKSLNGDTNILIMGLDSRLDENGNPLPQDIYNALHAGDDSVAGYNSNVLMLLHVPAQGKAVEISIPRDDYVALPGCPDGTCHEKIKQAYGLARDQKYNQLRQQGVKDKTTLEQESRDAGRKEEADTVSQFLGGVPIDHFIEVTLVAFYQIAQVVQPITVCVLKPTHDTYSGANFPAGMQQISGQQAVAFVRQRRDNVKGDYYYNQFTDLDRERRQQAFIASLAYQLKQAGTFTNPAKLSGILTVAKQNTAIDSGLDLLEFAQEASNLTSGQITFNTLPVQSFKDMGGTIGDVNIVDLPTIQAQTRALLGTPNPSSGAKPIAGPGAADSTPIVPGVVDVVNRSGQQGEAGSLEKALSTKGFTQGVASTESPTITSTVVEYGSSGAEASAKSVASLLGGVTVQHSSSAKTGRVRVVIGRDFQLPAALSPAPPATSTPATPPATAATGSTSGGSATAPTPLAGGSIPCVK